MSGVSLPVNRPIGRAMIVGSPASRGAPLGILQRLGFACAELDDPYAAMAELARRPLVYRAMILSLNSLYREELQLIATVKRRYPHVEIWLTQFDGRQAALAESMRYGADGLLSDDGLHRTGTGAPIDAALPPPVVTTIGPAPLPEPTLAVESPDDEPDPTMGEPVLTADELRALLAEQPISPPSGERL